MFFEKKVGAFILAVLLASQAASQVTRHVPSVYPTIQQAVDAATDGDTVAVGPGVYQENVAIQKFISVVSTHGPEMTHISCPSHIGPVVVIQAVDGPPRFSGFTVRDASTRALSANAWAVIENCIFRNNTGSGAIGTSPTFGPVTIIRCVVRENQGRHGGVNLPPSCFESFSGSPGALRLSGANPTILIECVILDNSGGDAGLNFCAGPVGNGGPGVYGGSGQLIMINCTVTGNVGGLPSTQVGSLEGAGVFDIVGDGPILYNCVVKGNAGLTFDTRDRATPIPPIIPVPGPLDIRNSNVEGYVPSQAPFPTDIFINNIDADPQFVDPMNGDYRLLPTSPCIDTGDAALAMSLTDFDGLPRVIGANVDMGCHEFVQPLPGTDEGLELRTTIDGEGADLHRKFAPGGSGLIASIEDDLGALAGAVPVLLGQVFGNDTRPVGVPSFPLHLDFPGLAIFHDGNATPGPLIGPMPVSFGPVAMPPGLAGLTLRLQAFGLTQAADNAIYAATHARDLEFQ